MKPYTKGFILLITLLFPILIYLFLRFFGNNKYELPLIDLNKNDCIEIFQNDSISNNYYSGYIKIIDYRLSNNSIIINNLLKRLYQKNNVSIITLSETKQNVPWLIYNFSGDIILEFIKCEYSDIKLNSFLVLYDQKNQIRGYYISDDPKEYERLDVEIDVLKSNYEK